MSKLRALPLRMNAILDDGAKALRITDHAADGCYGDFVCVRPKLMHHQQRDATELAAAAPQHVNGKLVAGIARVHHKWKQRGKVRRWITIGDADQIVRGLCL